MRKVTIIGAGNVGATAAMNIARMGICDTVVLLDIKEGVAEGKAIDIMQTLSMFGVPTNVIGVTGDYSATQESDVYVITSGIPRKPGMTREELVGVNSKVVRSVMDGITKYCYDHIQKGDEDPVVSPKFVVVSNPMDSMCMVVLKYLQDKYPASKETFYDQIIGMGGYLDSNRFKYYIKKGLEKHYNKNNNDLFGNKICNININDIYGYVVGGHGDTTMIPVYEDARWLSYPIQDLLTFEELNEVIENTMKGGATLTKLLGTSAWEAPAAGIAITVKAILNNEHKVIPCSSYGHPYKCFIGQLCTLGENGIENIDWKCETIERVQKKLLDSSEAIRNVNKSI